jgi:hypothetical protein
VDAPAASFFSWNLLAKTINIRLRRQKIHSAGIFSPEINLILESGSSPINS